MCPFLASEDTRNTKEIGQGQVASGFMRDVYVLDANTISNYDPADTESAWARIKFVEEFQTSIDTSELKVYNSRDTDHSIAGRKETTLSVKQSWVSALESIERYENKQVFWMEAIGDDRDPVDSTGKKIYSEIYIYSGKITKISKDKPTDNLFSVTGEGTFNSATVKRISRTYTPVTITNTTSPLTATSSTPKTIAFTAKDIYGATVDVLAANNPEISSVKIVKVSGPAFTQAGTNAIPTITYGASGTSVVKIVITTLGGFVAESAEFTITVS